MNLLEALLDQARRRPDAPAVIGPDGMATYRQLLIRACDYAKSFESRGVGLGERVGVVLAPGREAVAVSVAAFFVRAAYVPVDPGQAPVRAMTMLRNCTPRICVGEPAAGWEEAMLCAPGSLAGDAWPPPACGLAVPAPAVGADDDVAYVIHTSGSTGLPKGVEIEHAGVHNLLRDLQNRAPVGAGHLGSWWASPDFDASIMECWGPLCTGGTVVVMPPDDRWEGTRFAAFLDRQLVTSAFVPPSYLTDLLDYVRDRPCACRVLRRIITGAGPVPLGLLQGLLRARPELAIINAYGPAEATVCATLYTVPRTGGDPASRTPIGTAVAGNEVTIVGPDGRPSPDGVGELVVSGIGVGRGYLGVAGRADDRFIIPPDGAPGMRAYRSGDRVRLMPDGELLFLDRIDRQLKVRGYRIEPAEVEAAIREVARIREVVVDQRTVPGSGDLLVAYVVPASGAFDPDGIRGALRWLIPDYAIPAFFVTVDELPLTRNGKVDLAMLALKPLPARSRRDDVGERFQPGGELRVVLAAWRHELGDAVREDLGFVELGGSSLPAVRVAQALRSATGRAVSAADVLMARTARELAGTLAGTGAPAAEPAISQPGALAGPLSPGQLGLWFHDQLDGTGLAYLEPMAFVLPQGADVGRLSDALARTVAAHPALGATTERADGQVVRLLLGRHRIALERWSGGLQRCLAEPFALEGGPLMRAAVVGDGGTELLLLVWHHLVVDGWSVRLFLSCLERCYADPWYLPERPDLTVCGANAWLRQHAATAETAAAIEVLLSGLAGARFPAARHDVRGPGPVRRMELGADLSGQLVAAARRTGLTVSAYLLTAYQYALTQILDVTGAVMGCAVAGRIRPEFGDIIGYFANTVLVRIPDLAPAPCREAVRSVQAECAAARAAQEEIPFADVVTAWRKRRTDLPPRIPQLYFSFDEGYSLRLDGAECEPHPVTVPRALFGANLVLHSSAAGIAGIFEYERGLLDEQEAADLVRTFIAVLPSLADAGGQAPAGHRPYDCQHCVVEH